MIICPLCSAENIEGSDVCEHCEQTLTHMSIRVPASSVEADLTRDKIKLLKLKDPSTVAADTPVGVVLTQMVDEGIGCMMIMDGDQLVGIFSERDALMKLNTEAANLSDRAISRYMTPNPITLETRNKIAFALHKMDLGGYRHIPILEEGKLVSVLSIRDILEYLTQRIAAEA